MACPFGDFFTPFLGFPPVPQPLSSAAQAERLSLPACAVEVPQNIHPAERPSLAARRAAEPQVVANRIEGNSDGPDLSDAGSPLRVSKC
jgi:hypothetical protein